MLEPLKKTLHIEWRHLEVGGTTCTRCGNTGQTVKKAFQDLKRELGRIGVEVTFTETALAGDRIGESNIVLFNGVPLEKVLDGVRVSGNSCPSCSDLLGQDTCCRTIEFAGQVYEEIPESLIRKAAMQAVGLR